MKICRTFPQKKSIETTIIPFVNSEDIIYSHQKAECLRALRYLSRISPNTIKFAEKRLFDENEDRYVRMQAAYLLTRVELADKPLNKCIHFFGKEKDAYVKTALVCLMVQKRRNHSGVIEKILLDPNEKVHNLGKLFRAVREDVSAANNRMGHIFRPEQDWIICDNMPFLYILALSQNKEIKERFCDYLKKSKITCKIVGLRENLQKIHTWVCEDLKR